MPLLLKHFGCKVSDTSTERLGHRLVVQPFLAQAEVGQTGVALLVNNYIAGFQISVDDAGFVEGFEGQHNFSNVEPRDLLRQLVHFVENHFQVAVRAVVHKEEELICGLKCVVQLHDEGMVHVAQNFFFGLHILDHIFFDDGIFIDGLHGELLLCVVFHHQRNGSEGTGAKLADYGEVVRTDQVFVLEIILWVVDVECLHV